jgi:hypothetical protein
MFILPLITIPTLSTERDLHPSEKVVIPIGRKTVFSEENVEELVECLLIMENDNLGLIRFDLVVWHTM